MSRDVERKTCSQEYEDQDETNGGFEFSLRIEEESSDDEDQEAENVDDVSRAPSEVDIWKEFTEMSFLSFTSTLPGDRVSETEFPESVTYAESPPSAAHGFLEYKVEPSKLQNSTESSPENLITLDNSDHPLNSDSLGFTEFTLQGDMVTIPNLGTFRRKKHFSGLASNQLIEKMLSQSKVSSLVC